ncbi:MAG: thioredoxin family protein [Pirellulales bacterium]
MSVVVGACFAVGAVVHAADYPAAYRHAAESGRPLLVLVGTEWCPGCVKMKHQVIPQAQVRGTMSKVEFAQMDADDALAGQIMRGNSIPQLVMFTKTEAGWKRSQITGAKSVAEVESFINSNMPSPSTAVSSISEPAPRLGSASATSAR